MHYSIIPKLVLPLKLTVLVAFTFFIDVYGQTPPVNPVNTATDNLIPPAPEAAALGKYSTIPVGLYTGVPEISIPLWDLKEGDIDIPVSLSYHASGHKIDEIAPRTGMGWVLNAGGVITRTIMGQADEYGRGGFIRFAAAGNRPDNIFSGSNEKLYQQWDNLSHCGDAQPDQFSFNFAGYTGKFAFNWEGNIVVGSDKKVRIEPIGMPAPGDNNFIQGWKVTTDDGTIYRFEAKETSDLHITTGALYACNYLTPPVSSWYLTSITSPNGNGVNLYYESNTMDYWMRLSETRSHRQGWESPTLNYSTERMRIEGKVLNLITTFSGNTTIQFNSANIRTDVPGNTSNKSLDNVVVLNKDGQKLKHLHLGYDYSIGRLTLKTIQELPVDGGAATKPPYVFTYSGSLPTFSSNDNKVGFFQQDHWGFYNGNTMQSYIPTYTYPPLNVTYYGADRQPHPSKMTTGILTQIKYPTGGSTTFEYEPHDYSFIHTIKIAEKQPDLSKTVSVSHSGQQSGDTPESERTRKTFTIPANGASVTFSINVSYCNQFAMFTAGAAIYRSNGELIRSSTSAGTISGSLSIGPGDYYIEAFAQRRPCYIDGVPQPNWDNAAIRINWIEYSDEWVRKSRMAGGLRIKKITDYDRVNPEKNIVRKFEYKMFEIPDNQGPEKGVWVSSGVIPVEPRYDFATKIHEGGEDEYRPVNYISRISNSILALTTTQGSAVGYRQVNVFYGNNGENGKSESMFTSFYDTNDHISYELPFAPPSIYDYRRGLLKKQIDYRYQANSTTPYIPIRQLENEYDFNDGDNTRIAGYKVGLAVSGGGQFGPTLLERYAIGGFSFNLGITKIKKSTETFFENNNGFKVEQGYAYDSALQFLQKQTRKTSDGKELITEYSYPGNYTSASDVFSVMRDRHILAPVVEKIVKEKAGDGIERVIDAAFTQFDINSNNKVVPFQQLKFTATTPISDFTPSITGNGLPDSRYYTAVSAFDRYTDLAQPEQITTKPGDIVTSYIWGYGGNFPMAQVTNAPFVKCAFTGFESFDKGNWNFDIESNQYSPDAKTGKRSFKGILFSNNLENGRYVVSLWAKGSGNISVNGISQLVDGTWKLYKWVLPNPGTVTINTNDAFIDDPRLHPDGAQMKTFTYEPGIGITSTTDVNYKIVFYEYDSFKRLKNIKDQDKNIVRNYRYQYAGN